MYSNQLKRRVGAMALSIGFVAGQSLFGEDCCAQSSWDRRAEQIAIVSQPSDPAGTYRITGAWVVEASDVSMIPLNTKVTLSRNGTAIFSTTLDLTASAGVLGNCDFCPGPNTCICAEPSGPCSCNALWLTTAVPNAIPLAAGDVLTLQVANASGGVADANQANDVKTRTFAGQPAFWNRRVGSAQLTPSACPGAPDSYDLSYNVAVDFASMVGAVPMSGKLQLLLDGAIAAEFAYCEDSPWITTGANCFAGGCGFIECGSGSCAGANVDLDCQMVELQGGGVTTCVCSSGMLGFIAPGIVLPNLTPTSSIALLFVGSLSSSLPELAVLNGDNATQVALVVRPVQCDADINKDGKVDAADLALVLGAWGPCSD